MKKTIKMKMIKLNSFGLSAGLSAFLFCLCLVFTWSAPTSVSAQSNAKRVEQQLNTINRQLRALQETVLDHMDTHTGASAGDNGGVNDRALLADMEIRLGAIDREFRQLTGKIEEMDHRQRQLTRQFENFKADMELRFQDLSTGAGRLGDTSADKQTSEVAMGQEPAVEVGTQPQAATETIPGTTPEPVPEDIIPQGPDESYEQAFGFLRRGDFAGGERAFTEFLQHYSDHDLAGNAQYWLAETYYARRDYTNAAAEFLKGYQNYSDGTKAPDSLLKLGMSLAAMEQVEEACLVFDDLKIRYASAPQIILDSANREIVRNTCPQ